MLLFIRGRLIVKFAIYENELSLQKSWVRLTENIKHVKLGITIAIISRHLDVARNGEVSEGANIMLRSLEHDLDDGM